MLLKITDFEKERGLVFNENLKVTSKTPKSDLEKLILDSQNWIGVDYEQRTNFLVKNGYELTRENYTDPSLRTRSPIEG